MTRYRILITDETDAFHVSVPIHSPVRPSLAAAQETAVGIVRLARQGRRKYIATIHDLDDEGNPTHWRGLNLETMQWTEPVTVAASPAESTEAQ